MVEAVPSSDLFLSAGSPARKKVLLLGSLELLPEDLKHRVSSLQIEHVSPASLMRQGISRRASGIKAEEAILTAFRRWFWTRKPDAGFALTKFPATLLQAKVFDEWLDARSEALDAVLVAPDAQQELVEYYRNLGLLREAD